SSDTRRGVLVGALLFLLAAFQRRGGGERHAALIVDDLGVDVLGRTEDRQARTAVGQLTQTRARTLRALLGGIAGGKSHGLLLLAFLAADVFAGIAHALALVGLRRTDAA